MITVLVKGMENKETLKEENTILKFILKEYVKKSMDYKDLLVESLDLLDKYQEEVSNLKIRANLWADEVVRLYKQYGDLDKALNLTGREIMLYELNKNNGVEEE
ncbi:hypothetical protein G8E05_06325 [Clostridium botulinum]|uniref:hypothetical protein n=1 Tax=Clostridium botulinum TaxID=1491 RepID=UPI00035BACF9|nr:hypothetical protein [Clostridium botulinum]AJD27262.1 hypothetical protein T257_3112 [Clostridium botulinum CDC_297]EPS50163.1 hypothetical protein CFSAN002368_14928 [Clostridium botulinum A1 str. CFSAN002368]MBY6878417.1 hypothetical protein [Clostridium botulinum]MBY6892014.1 hypothetical protein [Clostridium botulinum]MBY6894448.1 hypothetical protein [Clostridium botulinum]